MRRIAGYALAVIVVIFLPLGFIAGAMWIALMAGWAWAEELSTEAAKRADAR